MKITTREELIAHIALHKAVVSEIPLFEGNDYNGNRWVVDKTIPARAEVIIGFPIFGHPDPTIELLYANGKVIGSLRDRNIPENTYNNHWWFTTREEAEEHIRPKEFVVGKYYEWVVRKGLVTEPLECVFVGKLQGAFKNNNGYLVVINTVELVEGHIRLRQLGDQHGQENHHH